MEMPLETLNHLFSQAVERFSTKRALLRFKEGDSWQELSYPEVAKQVRNTAIGLKKLGVKRQEPIAILSTNRPQWLIADFACLSLGCPVVPIYPTLTPEQIGYILNDAKAVAVFLAGPIQYEKAQAVKDGVSTLRHIIAFDQPSYAPEMLTIEALGRMGRDAEKEFPEYQEESQQVGPDDLATIIYTSGTTGAPKGVMLTHGNLVSNVLGAKAVLPVDVHDVCLSLLPLSHGFERTAGHFVMVHAGVTINYAEDMDSIGRNILEVKPTVMLGVPRLYEKMYANILHRALSGNVFRKRIFLWARRIGETWAEKTLNGEKVPLHLKARYRVAVRMVFKILQEKTGGRIRYFISGGAPLSPDIALFFYAAGLPILEGYGLTETSPVISVNPLDGVKLGTVGKALPGIEINIAADGEILVRGPCVMKGYLNHQEKTSEAIDVEGWFHTGDIGELDEDGYLRITDRKKDLIITAGGKNIAPQPIENQAKANPFILNAVLIGDRRKFPVLLVVPNTDALGDWAGARKLQFDNANELMQIPEVASKTEREAMLALRDLADYERPKKILIVEEDFSIERGELTPTLKVKRRVVEEHYREQINQLFEET